MKIVQLISKAYDKLIQGIVVVLSAAIMFLVVLIAVQVFTRFFSTPILWTTDLANCILVALGFLGSGWLLRQEGHVSVDIIFAKLNKKIQIILNIITSILGLCTTVILMVVGFQVTYSQYTKNAVIVSAEWDIPKYLIQVMIPIGMTFLTIEFVRKIKKHIGELRVKS